MKVYQIISEAAFIPATPAELAIMDPNQLRKYRRAEAAAKQAATATAQQQAKASADSAARRAAASKMRYQKDKPIASRASDIKQAAADKLKTTGPVGKAIAQKFEPGTKPQDEYKKVRDFIAKNTIKPTTVRGRMAASLGKWFNRTLRVLQVLGLGQILFEYYQNMEAIDQLEELGKTELQQFKELREGLSVESADTCRRMTREIVLAKLVTVGAVEMVVKGLARTTTVASTAAIVAAAAAGFFASMFSFGTATLAAIALIAASNVASTAMLAWLYSDAGNKMAQYLVLEWIDPSYLAAKQFGSDQLNQQLMNIGLIAKKDKAAAPVGQPITKPSDTKAGAASADVDTFLKTLGL